MSRSEPEFENPVTVNDLFDHSFGILSPVCVELLTINQQNNRTGVSQITSDKWEDSLNSKGDDLYDS